jgi:hypothetical protein
MHSVLPSNAAWCRAVFLPACGGNGASADTAADRPTRQTDRRAGAPAVFVLVVHVGAYADEPHDDLVIAVARRKHQRGVSTPAHG